MSGAGKDSNRNGKFEQGLTLCLVYYNLSTSAYITRGSRNLNQPWWVAQEIVNIHILKKNHMPLKSILDHFKPF